MMGVRLVLKCSVDTQKTFCFFSVYDTIICLQMFNEATFQEMLLPLLGNFNDYFRHIHRQYGALDGYSTAEPENLCVEKWCNSTNYTNQAVMFYGRKSDNFT